MNSLMNFVFFSETSAAQPEIAEVVTEYQDVTVSVIKFVGLGAAMLLPIVFAVVAFLFVYRRYANWVGKFLVGVLAGLLSMVAMTAASYLPPLQKLQITDETTYSLICTTMIMLLEVICLYFGSVYVCRSTEKKLQTYDLSAPLAMGLGFFFIQLMTNNIFNYCLNYFLLFSSVNSSGFDSVVAQVMNSYRQQLAELGDQAADVVLPEVQEIAFQFNSAIQYAAAELLTTAVTLVTYGIAVAAALIIIYGTKSEKLEEKFLFLAPVFIIVFYIPNYVSRFASINLWLRMGALIVITGLIIFFTVRIMKKYMPADWEEIRHPKKRSDGFFGRGRRNNQPPKMPKIVMPK